MAWEHLITADAFDNQIFSGGSSLERVTRSTQYARTGNYSFRFESVSIFAPIAYILVEPSASKYVAFSVARDNSVSDSMFYVMEGSTTHVWINFRTYENRVDVYRAGDGVLLASIPGHLPYSILYLDMFFYIHDSEGRVVIKDDNGVALVDYTGDTRNGGSGVIDRLQWRAGSTLATSRMYIDDIAVRTDDFCGTGGNYVRTVIGDGDDTEWVASAGQPWECVDEILSTMSDYISASSADTGARATFQGSSPGDLATIDVVGVYALSKLEFAGSGAIRPVIKSALTYGVGNIAYPGSNEIWLGGLFDTDPNTSAPWSKSALLASQFGVEVA